MTDYDESNDYEGIGAVAYCVLAVIIPSIFFALSGDDTELGCDLARLSLPHGGLKIVYFIIGEQTFRASFEHSDGALDWYQAHLAGLQGELTFSRVNINGVYYPVHDPDTVTCGRTYLPLIKNVVIARPGQ